MLNSCVAAMFELSFAMCVVMSVICTRTKLSRRSMLRSQTYRRLGPVGSAKFQTAIESEESDEETAMRSGGRLDGCL
jgi:hypothetical protein